MLKANLEGYLLKLEKGILKKEWKKRYFQIEEFKFSCFVDKDSNKLKAVCDLREVNGYTEDTSKDKQNIFLFAFSDTSNQTFRLQASSKEEREQWILNIAKWSKAGAKGKLAGKQISTVEESVVLSIPSNQPNVEISKMNLTEIPEAVWNVTAIESLILSENRITDIPPQISNLKTLRVLNLSYNSLNELPDSIGELENLIELNLHSNNLTKLPDSIGKLSKLELLWVSQNQLNTLPECVSKLPLLNKLSVAFNSKGCKLPAQFACAKQMTWLDISGNKYDILPEVVFTLINLQILEASSNNLKDLPKEITQLKLLREIKISHNAIEHLPDEFGSFPQLQELDLAFNNLSDLPNNLGTSNAFLQVHNNPFTEIPENIIEKGSGTIKQYLRKRTK